MTEFRESQKRGELYGPPNCVRVIGAQVPVLVRSPEADTYLDERMGYCDGPRGRIVLNSNQSQEQMRECLLHESIHAVDFAMGVGLEEEQVRRLARGLYALLRDSDGLSDYLTREG